MWEMPYYHLEEITPYQFTKKRLIQLIGTVSQLAYTNSTKTQM